MKLHEKVDYLQTNRMGEWLKTRQEVEDTLSEKQSMFCLCGRLATGLHESHCKKFRNKVTSETVKILWKDKP